MDTKQKTTQRERLTARNEAIRNDFLELYNKGYRNDYCVDKLAEKYPLSHATIEDIVWKRGIYSGF